jgi:hypothetical protein
MSDLFQLWSAMPCVGLVLVVVILTGSQQKPVQGYIMAPIAAPASDWIVEKEQPLEIHQAKSGETHLGRKTLAAS